MRQAQTLLNTPDITTKKGLRDRAIVGVLLGCELRRSEVASLSFKHVQQRDSRWCIVDLVGKHGRVRTVPMPTWFTVCGVFRDLADFAVLVLFQKDDPFGHPLFSYLPDGDLAVIVHRQFLPFFTFFGRLRSRCRESASCWL